MGALSYLDFQAANGLLELIHMDHLFPFHFFPAARTGLLSRRHGWGYVGIGEVGSGATCLWSSILSSC